MNSLIYREMETGTALGTAPCDEQAWADVADTLESSWISTGKAEASNLVALTPYTHLILAKAVRGVWAYPAPDHSSHLEEGQTSAPHGCKVWVSTGSGRTAAHLTSQSKRIFSAGVVVKMRAARKARAIALLNGWLGEAGNAAGEEAELNTIKAELDQGRKGYRQLFPSAE